MKKWPVKLINRFRLSRREYYADFFITPPITALYAYLTIRHGVSGGFISDATLFGLGVVAWTLYEYFLHRVFLHHGPALFRILHGLHHARQNEYIALHPVGTLLTYSLFFLLFGVHSITFMLGFSCGYIVYSATHTALHYNQDFCQRHLPRLLFHHRQHHRQSQKNFGIVTRFWDRLFGTMATP